MKKNSLENLFDVKKPVIGMIHLAGDNPVDRGIDELKIYQEEGVEGAIIENYHGSSEKVYQLLKKSNSVGLKIVRCVNLLGDYSRSFKLAKEFGGKFVQLDSVQTPDLNLMSYKRLRKDNLKIKIQKLEKELKKLKK